MTFANYFFTSFLVSFLQVRLSYRGHLPRYSCRNRAEANERLAIFKDLGRAHQAVIAGTSSSPCMQSK